MASYLYHQMTLLLLVFFHISPIVKSFTVIASDSTAPSALIDGPQTGFTIPSDGARTDPEEQKAVYDVMKATGNGWATQIPDVCRGRWHGIECMPDEDNVYHVVSLSFGALSDDTAFPTCDPKRSVVPEALTRLPHIRTLFFYRCFSQKPQRIPAFLGRLGPTLQTLVLRDNGLLGPIPNELGNLTRLRVLDLRRNNLNGSIPLSFSQLTGLRSLDLSGNRLTGSVPGFGLPALNVLDLNQNLLTGSIPSGISNCQSLIKIDFSRNRLTGPIPDSINQLRELVLMDLSYNRLVGPFPSSFEGLTSLQALILQGNRMGSTTIRSDAFRGLKNLMTLVLSDMNLQGPIPESLGELPNLRVIHLDGNNLNGSIPSNFGDMKQLSELRLNDNNLAGSVPFGREMAWRMRKKLRLNDNSGLCLNPNSGLEDVLDSTFFSGIRSCDSAESHPGSSRTVQHLSSGAGHNMTRTVNTSSDSCREASNFLGLYRLSTFLVFVWVVLSGM